MRLVRTAFSNRYFLAFLAVVLVEASGLLHTRNLDVGWRNVESKCTLIAIPFVLCSGPFTDAAGRRRLMSAYCVMLAAICLFCLYKAFRNYYITRDSTVFFYHTFSRPIGVNAIFFSGYVVCAMLFLFSSWVDYGKWPGRRLSPQATKASQVLLILLFLVMVVLLSSKLILILVAIMGLTFLTEQFRRRTSRWLIVIPALVAVILAGVVAFTDNPVKSRYEAVMNGNPKQFKEEQFNSETSFDGVSIRLLIARYGWTILNEQKAWIFGVSPGDAQALLDRKYIDAGMYLGVPGTHNRGFLGYNFHNQFLEELIRNGAIGFCVFVLLWVALVRLALSRNTKEAWFTVLLLLLLNLTQSMLEMQHSILLCCFFPFLLLSLPPASVPAEAGQAAN